MLRKITSLLMLFVLAAAPAFATPTALTVLTLKQNNYAVVGGDLALSYTACDNVNGNSFVATGQEILLVQNADGAASHTFTVTSVADQLGRTDSSLTGYSLAQSTFAVVQMRQVTGWAVGNIVSLACNSAQIKFAVIRFQ
jgi:hypothetical protein